MIGGIDSGALTRDLARGELEAKSFWVPAEDLPEGVPKEGARGAVVEALGDGAAYVVEFSYEDGWTVALPALRPEDLRLAWKARE